MKWLSLVVIVVVLTGCENLRFAPTQIQKQNALLHNRTAALAAQRAKNENSSDILCSLTNLSAEQSKAFVADTGLPQNPSAIYTEQEILEQGGFEIAQAAAEISAQRPDVWDLTDSAMELGIALAGLVGGVYGLKATQYLQITKDKSKALKEIVNNNELFKKMYPEAKEDFKYAQSTQSPITRQIVSQTKNKS